MKIIIPVAGEGTRLRPHSYTTPKALLEIAGKPILGHIIDQVTQLNFSEIVFITGSQGHQIADYVRGTYDFKSSYVQQGKLYGLGYAVHLGIGDTDEELLVILGDTIVELDFAGLVNAARNALVVKEVEDPRAFGVVEVEGDRIVRLVEKPKDPPSKLAVVGVYFIRDTKAFQECTNEIIHRGVTTHGEIQLTDAFDLFLKKGFSLYTYPTIGWYDCGNKETILKTNRFLLERDMGVSQDASSSIVAPSYIAPSAKITNSIVGPYAFISENVVITDSIIKNSIVWKGALIESSTIEDSLIGSNCRVRGGKGIYNIGDSSEVGGT